MSEGSPCKKAKTTTDESETTKTTTTAETEQPLVAGFHKGWYHEINDQWPGIASSLQCETVLFDEKSLYQHVQVFKSKSFGNVLILDGVVQLTERDEMAYQEMITHLPLFSHPNPKTVLIIGGGDGGVLREVVKHACVDEIVICEIDQMVIDCGKKYFPNVACAWDDPRVTLFCGDASEFVKNEANKSRFDAIVCDSSDPVGPAEALFASPFFVDMHACLRPGGRISTQAESMWLHLDLIKSLVTMTSLIFDEVHYATTQIPTYPCGQIGLLQLQKKGDATTPTNPPLDPARKPAADFPLRYYSPDLHRAAFTLPKFVTDAVAAAKSEALSSGKVREETTSP